MRAGRTAAALILWNSAAVAQQREPAVDHVILGVSDLRRGMDEVERLTGVRPAYGGAHPGGTHNALLALGSGRYLELLAPNPKAALTAKERADFARYTRPTPIGWAVGTDSIVALRTRLARAGWKVTAVSPGSRLRPDGTRIRWSTFEIGNSQDAVTPFFIQWNDRTKHPSRTAPPGCSLSRLALTDRQPAALRGLMRILRLSAKVDQGPQNLKLVLNCPKGRITF